MYFNIWLAKPTWELSRGPNNDYPSCEQWDTLSKQTHELHITCVYPFPSILVLWGTSNALWAQLDLLKFSQSEQRY